MDVNFVRISFVFLGFLVDLAVGGECCKAYYDLTLDYHKQKWCSDYCCGSSALGVLDCCNNLLLVAPEGDRVGFCADFFLKNIWAPILIGLGGLGTFICCIVICVACFGGSKKRGAVVNQAPQQPATTNLIMMAPGVQNPQPSADQGHGQYPGPVYPPQYQSVPGSGFQGPVYGISGTGLHQPAAPTPGIPATGPVAGNAIEPETESKHPFASTE